MEKYRDLVQKNLTYRHHQCICIRAWIRSAVAANKQQINNEQHKDERKKKNENIMRKELDYKLEAMLAESTTV